MSVRREGGGRWNKLTRRLRERGTGWQRCIIYLKLQVSFRKRATNYGALLRKITYKDKASYGSSPPCKNSPGIFKKVKKSLIFWELYILLKQPCILSKKALHIGTKSSTLESLTFPLPSSSSVAGVCWRFVV